VEGNCPGDVVHSNRRPFDGELEVGRSVHCITTVRATACVCRPIGNLPASICRPTSRRPIHRRLSVRFTTNLVIYNNSTNSTIECCGCIQGALKSNP